jgi:putative membrane protein (TIGR04086 family)
MARGRRPSEPTGVAPYAHLRGLGLALALTAFFLIGISFFVSVAGLTEVAARWIMVVGGAIAVVVGSSQTGKRMGRAGWLNGGITGLAYAVVLLILAILLDIGLSPHSLITLGASFILGAAGGVLGVNRR